MNSNNAASSHSRILKMVLLAFFAALIIVLQLFSGYFKIGPVSISLVLIPIVIGGIISGIGGGAFLGGVFGVICVIMGLSGMDGGTLMLLEINPFLTVLIAIGKGILAGAAGAAVFKLFMKLFGGKVYPSALLASAVVPVVNTGLFFVSAYLVFKDTLIAWAGGSATTFFGIFAALFLINFVVEFALNVVVCPVVATLLSSNRSLRPFIHKA